MIVLSDSFQCFSPKNFLLMEPLEQTGATGQSGIIQEEGVVASIRSVIKELQESVQNLCKESLSKITKIGRIIFLIIVFSFIS